MKIQEPPSLHIPPHHHESRGLVDLLGNSECKHNCDCLQGTPQGIHGGLTHTKHRQCATFKCLCEVDVSDSNK